MLHRETPSAGYGLWVTHQHDNQPTTLLIIVFSFESQLLFIGKHRTSVIRKIRWQQQSKLSHEGIQGKFFSIFHHHIKDKSLS